MAFNAKINQEKQADIIIALKRFFKGCGNGLDNNVTTSRGLPSRTKKKLNRIILLQTKLDYSGKLSKQEGSELTYLCRRIAFKLTYTTKRPVPFLKCLAGGVVLVYFLASSTLNDKQGVVLSVLWVGLMLIAGIVSSLREGEYYQISRSRINYVYGPTGNYPIDMGGDADGDWDDWYDYRNH